MTAFHAQRMQHELPDPWESTRPAYLRLKKTMSEARLPIPAAPSLDTVAGVEAIFRRIDDAAAAVAWSDVADDDADFVTPTEERRNLAIRFVRTLTVQAESIYGIRLPIPEFSPTADGGVDVHWGAGSGRELLLGVRPDGTIASFFGQASNGDTIKGVLDLNRSNSWLVGWLLDDE